MTRPGRVFGHYALSILDLSIKIEEAVANDGPGAAGRNSFGRWLFYILVLPVLVTGLLLSGFKSSMLKMPRWPSAVIEPAPAPKQPSPLAPQPPEPQPSPIPAMP